jgi:hypothetical protein
MPDQNVYHRESGHRVVPGDPIMDRLGDIATFIGLIRRPPPGAPVRVAVRWTHQPERLRECQPSTFNLHVA